MQPDMIGSAIHALQLWLEPARLMILCVGVLIGLAIGVLPGLSGIVAQTFAARQKKHQQADIAFRSALTHRVRLA